MTPKDDLDLNNLWETQEVHRSSAANDHFHKFSEPKISVCGGGMWTHANCLVFSSLLQLSKKTTSQFCVSTRAIPVRIKIITWLEKLTCMLFVFFPKSSVIFLPQYCLKIWSCSRIPLPADLHFTTTLRLCWDHEGLMGAAWPFTRIGLLLSD